MELTEHQNRIRKALYESVAFDYRCSCLKAMGEQDVDRNDVEYVLRTGVLIRADMDLNRAIEIWTVAGVSLDGVALEASFYFCESRFSIVNIVIQSTEN